MSDRRPYSVTYNVNWDSRIKNLNALPSGTGGRFLKCLIGEGEDLIAASWHRREPKPQQGYMIFRFF